ncbi:hypothetical protein GDO86_003144 [Hymenochirus boettgeri]|uniref:Uncharacterized protein n=1 Tax=Hymenochirus boettgeri TaxID=247094 RepID=A0A8T2K5W4_9PIPI|nr:hypothetical protein GDO86_003144 [Hymenochirus boettgeri]
MSCEHVFSMKYCHVSKKVSVIFLFIGVALSQFLRITLLEARITNCGILLFWDLGCKFVALSSYGFTKCGGSEWSQRYSNWFSW